MGDVHLLCLSAEGERLAKPFGGAQVSDPSLTPSAALPAAWPSVRALWPPQYVHHGVLEFLALAESAGATPLLLSPSLLARGESGAAGSRPLGPEAASELTASLRSSGPLAVGGLTARQALAIGARLVSIDLYRLLGSAATLEE